MSGPVAMDTPELQEQQGWHPAQPPGEKGYPWGPRGEPWSCDVTGLGLGSPCLGSQLSLVGEGVTDFPAHLPLPRESSRGQGQSF